MSRTRAAGSQSDCRHHRQPEREKRRKGGACIDLHGYDAGKKIKGKKRHILVDTLGLLLHAIVHPADIQDRDGGILDTIASQVTALRERIATDGFQLEPDYTYVDEGFSGAILLRPALERLRDAVAGGHVELIYVPAPGR